jgi:dihydropteroate synthase
LRHLAEFKTLGYPLLVGLSRKSMLGQVVDKPVDKRLFAGLAATAVALMNGAQIIRTHDVAETLDVIKMVHAVML